MSGIEQVRELLPKMTLGEKALVLQWIARDIGNAYPGIEVTPGVAGGEPCVGRTRIPVWVLVQARNLGAGDADILRAYPGLQAEDLANTWAFYRTHRRDIDRQIVENELA